MIVPVGSSGAPAKSNDEVTRVVPVGSVSASALVVLEVGQVAVVVLNVIDGLTFLELDDVVLRFGRNRSGSGQAEKAEESGRELHVVMMIDECDCVLCGVSGCFVRVTLLLDIHGKSRRCQWVKFEPFSLKKSSKLSSNIKAPTFTQASHKRTKLVLSLGHGAWLRIQPVKTCFVSSQRGVQH